MMKRIFLFGAFMAIAFYAVAQRSPISLAGTWHMKLDSADRGVAGKWYNQRFEQTIKLPGTLDDAGIGSPVHEDTSVLSKNVMLHLARRVKYVGPVWYQKTIKVNNEMGDAQLLLERVLWKTDCWIDGRMVGSQESLIAPQTFSLGKIKPGNHTITLRIDNGKLYEISVNDFAHAYTDGTQIIWNGVIGRMEINDHSVAAFAQVFISPSLIKKEAVANILLEPQEQGKVYLQTRILLDGKLIKQTKRVLLQTGSAQQAKVFLPQAKPWDEFHPNVYGWEFDLTDTNGKILASRIEHFGFRSLTAQGNSLQINGRPLFLRGTLECNIFPLEGHPPMGTSGWLKVFATAKQYGLNHLRFHSWCPPEAAFRVADSLGFYLHVELPLWALTVGKDPKTLSYLENEAQQIISNYGNHPSFCFWSMGNELEGDFAWLENLVRKLKKQDNRHLYTTTTFSFQKGHGKAPEPADDYFITQYTDKGWVRGQGIFNTNTPDFKTDYSKAVKGTTVPLIIHEVGQYSVYPDLTEIAKYTGVLTPSNFSAVRNDLKKKGMLGLAVPYLKASGTLSANLYKEEIERALKTRGVGGFQLLDLHDFPGQGTALVGILNAFWDSKGIIEPEAFRRFCGPVVPLLRFEKAAYVNKETFEATAEIANYSDKTINDELLWTVSSTNNKILFKGSLGKQRIPIGNAEVLGKFSVPLKGFTQAQELTVSLSLAKGNYTNQWKIWVYPDGPETTIPGVHFTTSLDSTIRYLNAGSTVVFNPDTSEVKGIDGRFAPVFWSPVHFPDQPGSMGLLIDNKHPALADFPTSAYSDWQWWDLVTRSRSVQLDAFNGPTTPIIRVIDNFFKNRNLGVLMEFKVGTGKLIICTMDLHHDLGTRPAARQLKNSLIQYAGKPKINPLQKITINELSAIIKGPAKSR